MKRTFVILASVLLLACSAYSAPPLAEKAPADSILYVGWAGRSLPLDGSMFGQLLQEPGVKDLFAAIREGALTGIGDDETARTVFESLWAMGGIAWQRPAALCLIDIQAPGPQAGPGDPQPVGMFLIDLQKDKAAFEAHFQKLLAALGKQMELSQLAVGNISCQGFDTPAGKCTMGFLDNVFFVAIGPTTPMTLAAVAEGRQPSLAKDDAFNAAMGEVSGENVLYCYYLNVPAVLEIVGKVTPPAPEGEEDPVKAFFRASAINDITAVAGASSIVARGLHEKLRIFSPAPHSGMLSLLAGKPLGADALAGVPDDADYLLALNLDPAAMLVELKRLSGAIDPEAQAQLESVLAAGADALGVDIEKDLLAHMGDQWTVVSAASLGGTLTGTVLVVQLKDAARFSSSLAKLEAKLAEQFGGGEGGAMPADPMMGPMSGGGGGGPRLAIRSYKSGKVEVHYIKSSAAPGETMFLPVAPAWAVHEGKLYVAAFPQVIAAMTEGTTQPPLAKDANFLAFRKRLSPNASAISYINTPSILRGFYGGVLVGGTMAANMVSQFAPSVSPEMLPPLPKVEKYVWPFMSAVSSDDKGILLESYGSLPSWLSSSINNLPLQGPAMAVSVLVPRLMTTRVLAKRALSGGNLNAIGKGVAIYAAEHNDAFPPNLEALVKEGLISPKMLVSPSGSGRPGGPPDYVYLAGKYAPNVPPDIIMAYERPELNGGEGTNILFTGTYVKWVGMAEFNKAMARTKKFLEERGAGEQTP